MEDSLTPFIDLLEDDTDEGTGGFREFDDYGGLYEYDNGFEDFSVWDGVFENRQRAPQSVLSQMQVAEVGDQSDNNELHNLLTDDFAEASTSSQSQNSFQSVASPHIAPPDPELRCEMLELLSIFQVVYENKSAIDTRILLKKCIYMCEQIMERYYRLPQVEVMHEQAKSLLQMFENGEAESPFTRSNPSLNCASENNSSPMRSIRDTRLADVKEALDRVDRDAEENDLFKDPDGGKEVDGVYICKGIWYCKSHIEREQCILCGVDYRLLNQVHRSRTEEAKIDDILRKEQHRLEQLERHRIIPVHMYPDADDLRIFI